MSNSIGKIGACGLSGRQYSSSEMRVDDVAKPKKGNRINIILECTEARKLGASPSRYSTTKNRRNTTARMEIKKYNPSLKRHTLHKEIK